MGGGAEILKVSGKVQGQHHTVKLTYWAISKDVLG